MANDIYLQIDGIQGESTDDGHREWIEVSKVSFGVMQPRSATASTGGGHTAERAELTDINFFKVADLSSPLLFQTCAQGRTIPKAKFEFMRADGKGMPIKYYEIELENVLIGRLAMDAVDGELLGESIGLKYSKIKVKYTEQKIAGGAGGNTTGSWNLANNRTT
jgi:type VI secretion system secreted protein Hcp